MKVGSMDRSDNDFVKDIADAIKPESSATPFVFAPKIIPFFLFPSRGLARFLRGRKSLAGVFGNRSIDILHLHLSTQRDDLESILPDAMLAFQAFPLLIGTLNTIVVSDLNTYFLAVHPETQRRTFEEVRLVDGPQRS